MYYPEGVWRDYYPDFLVKYQGDPVLRIVETKTWKEKDSLKVQAKTEAALRYADNNNTIYHILFDEDIAKYGIDIEVAKVMPFVTLETN